MNINLLDVLDRTQDGPFCTEKEWDMRVIPRAVAKLLKKYELKGTCNPENPVNCDDALADRFWEAGLDMAIDTGMLCVSTERIIKISREETLTGIREAPDRLHLGEGADACDWKPRKPEDPHPPITLLGSFGTAVTEELFIPVTQSICQNRSIDGTVPANLTTVYGRELRSGSPYETLGGAHETWLVQEALKRAGRPGMFVLGTSTSPTEYAVFGGLGIPGGRSPLQTLVPCNTPSELKADYHILQKVAYCLTHFVAPSVAHWTMIGGYSGGPEGCVVTSVAAAILGSIVMRAYTVFSSTIDLKYIGNTGREALWTTSVSYQALSRNTHLLTRYPVNPVSGPLTDMILHEVTASTLTGVVSGATAIQGVRTAGGKFLLRTTGVENGYAGELAKSAAGMTRQEANEIVKQLLPKYEEQLKRPPIGVTFPECYDVRTVKPSKDWEDIYRNAKKEAAALGVPFPQFE